MKPAIFATARKSRVNRAKSSAASRAWYSSSCRNRPGVCGSAGVYNITQPEMAARLQERKLANVFATGAEAAVTANPGCHLQLADGARRAGRELRVVHPVSLLARAYRAER